MRAKPCKYFVHNDFLMNLEHIYLPGGQSCQLQLRLPCMLRSKIHKACISAEFYMRSCDTLWSFHQYFRNLFPILLVLYGCWTKNRWFYPPNHPFVHRGFPLFSPSILGAHPNFWKHPYRRTIGLRYSRRDRRTKSLVGPSGGLQMPNRSAVVFDTIRINYTVHDEYTCNYVYIYVYYI